jgi:hypothetical protein
MRTSLVPRRWVRQFSGRSRGGNIQSLKMLTKRWARRRRRHSLLPSHPTESPAFRGFREIRWSISLSSFYRLDAYLIAMSLGEITVHSSCEDRACLLVRNSAQILLHRFVRPQIAGHASNADRHHKSNFMELCLVLVLKNRS